MRLAGEGVEEVGEELLATGPGRLAQAEPVERGVEGQVGEEDGEATQREPAAVQVTEVDAVEALKVGF